jgi:hypothetical protein
MAVIKCEGRNCPIRDFCRRFRDPSVGASQKWGQFKYVEEEGGCDGFKEIIDE